LRIAFRKLIPHFAFICEEIKDEKLVKKAIESPKDYLMDRESSKDESFFKYSVYQFAITDKKDAGEYISISGSKQLESLEEIVFTTPSISLIDADYKFIEELNESIDELKKEVLAYMQGKQAPKTQLEMFGSEEDDFDDFDDQMKEAGQKLKDMGVTGVTLEVVNKE